MRETLSITCSAFMVVNQLVHMNAYIIWLYMGAYIIKKEDKKRPSERKPFDI